MNLDHAQASPAVSHRQPHQTDTRLHGRRLFLARVLWGGRALFELAALIIEVIDDGQGLPPAHRCGVGLTSMRERAEELGGIWQIEPGPNGGTCVRAQIPYR